MIEISINNLPFTVSSPYAEGHVCNGIEAQTLNSARAEELKTQFTKHLKAKLGGVEPSEAQQAELQAELSAMDSGFALTGAASDPISREALKLARPLVETWLQGQGLALDTYPRAKFDEMVRKASTLPHVRAEAKRRLDDAREAAKDVLGV